MDVTLPSYRPTIGRDKPLVTELALNSPERVRSVRAVALLIPIAWVILLNAFCVGDLSLENKMLASIICIVSWLPMVMHIWRRPEGIPFMPALCLVNGICYSWVVFLSGDYSRGANQGNPMLFELFTDDLLSRSLTWTLLGVLCLMTGYYLVSERALAMVPRVKIPFDGASGIHTAVLTGIFALGVAVIPPELIPSRFNAITQVITQLFSFSLAILYYYYLQGRLSLFPKLFLWGLLVPVQLTLSLTSGAVAHVMLDIMLMMGTYWFARRQWPWRAGLVFGLLLIPLLGVKGQYREKAWFDNAGMNSFDKASLFLGMVADGFARQDGFFSSSSETTVHRLDQTLTFCLVLRLTPNVIPYWDGESYATLYWMVIPRFLYPDKPSKTIGQDFGHRYALLSSRDTVTSWNCPQLVEMYANFGPWGVIFGMLLLGVICRVLYYTLTDPNAGPGTTIVAIVMFVRLCDVESDFSMVFGGLLLNVLGLVLLVRLFHTRRIRMPLVNLHFH